MENRREENEQDVYIYPMQAKRKLRLAKKNLRTVYIYGVTGIGKTALLSHFLENRDSLWLDAAKVTEEELLLALQKEQMAVVVDNIQFAEPEEIRNGILALTAKTDIWLLIAGRCPCPPWLAGAAMKHVPFLLIEEEELRLSEKEMQEYLEASQVELGGDMVRTLCQQVNGHPLALKIAVQMMKQRERGPDTKQYVYDEEIFRKEERCSGIMWRRSYTISGNLGLPNFSSSCLSWTALMSRWRKRSPEGEMWKPF